MNVIETPLPGVLILEPEVFADSRGFFTETYRRERFVDVGIDVEFVQDNHSRSAKGVLRGLHLQQRRPQGKLIWVPRGRVFDVVADVDPSSGTYAHHAAVELSDDNHRQLYVPPGYAHGFLVLSESADFCYKCTEYFDPAGESGVIWNDADLAIDWPISDPVLSLKDRQLPTLRQANEGVE